MDDRKADLQQVMDNFRGRLFIEQIGRILGDIPGTGTAMLNTGQYLTEMGIACFFETFTISGQYSQPLFGMQPAQTGSVVKGVARNKDKSCKISCLKCIKPL